MVVDTVCCPVACITRWLWMLSGYHLWLRSVNYKAFLFSCCVSMHVNRFWFNSVGCVCDCIELRTAPGRTVPEELAGHGLLVSDGAAKETAKAEAANAAIRLQRAK